MFAAALFIFERSHFISAHFDRDELFGKCKSYFEHVKSEPVGRVNANVLTHMASKKPYLTNRLKLFVVWHRLCK